MAMKEGCGLDGNLPSLLYSLPGCHVNASVYDLHHTLFPILGNA